VVGLLRANSLTEARAAVGRLQQDATNPFLLVCADTGGRGFWASTAEGLHPRELSAGLLVLGNLPPGDADDAKLQHAADLLREPPLDGLDEEQLLRRLQAALSAHHGNRGPRESLCVHTAGNYGTVSSTVLLASDRLGQGRLLHASGPPCLTPYDDHSQLLAHLERRAGLADALAAFAALDVPEQRHRQRMLALLSEVADPFTREHYAPGHFTASGFVLSPDRTRLLLVHHAKLDRWLQPGGHIEDGDSSALAAARREVVEESGVRLQASPDGTPIFDVDVHAIPGRGEVPAHEHFDVRFLLQAAGETLQASADVRAARWVPVAELERALTDDSVLRAVRKLRVAAS
jgi:8-oxo-dGTP pyrophosphatase MutT (NUDIX family)